MRKYQGGSCFLMIIYASWRDNYDIMNGLQDNENIWHKRSGFEQFSWNIIHKQGWFSLRRKNSYLSYIYIETFTAHYLSFIRISDEWRSRIPFLRDPNRIKTNVHVFGTRIFLSFYCVTVPSNTICDEFLIFVVAVRYPTNVCHSR